MKILIVKISSMGDIIHTLPAITDAANIIPNIKFDWIIEKIFSEIPTWHPSIKHIIPIQLRLWKKKWYYFHLWNKYFNYIKIIKHKKYDIIIDAQGLLKTSLFITSMTNGIKHGLDYSSATEPISCYAFHKKHFIDKTQHAVERIRKLFSYSLQYSIPSCLGQYNIKNTFKPINTQKYNTIPYLIFLHSTTQPEKHWPELYWRTITKFSIDLGYCVKFLFWTTKDILQIKNLKNYFKQNITILLNLTLQETAIQILRSVATISVDTGLSHLAASFDHPNLTLYGPTDPNLIGTYGLNQLHLRSKTKLMHHLKPFYVWQKFQETFKI